MTVASGRRVWTGSWVTARWDVQLRSDDSPVDVSVSDLLGIALRRNPRRTQLLVSTVLGKHVPTDPRLVWAAGRLLGALVAGRLGGSALPAELGGLLRAAIHGVSGAPAALLNAVGDPGGVGSGVVVLGYAETATGLGHAVADALPDCYYLHSTRRAVPGVHAVAGFEEEHSHATSHLLLPEDPGALIGTGPLVLVDDELSTGRTVRNTIAALHELSPRGRYVVAALADLRGPEDRVAMDRLAAELDASIDVVALASGEIRFPADPPPRNVRRTERYTAQTYGRSASIVLDGLWPLGLRDGGRHGYRRADREALQRQLPRLAARLNEVVTGPRVLVLGTEELMYTPLRLGIALAEVTDAEVLYSTTTRSPAMAVDDPGYPLRTMIAFPTAAGDRFGYNVAPGAGESRFDTIVVVTDTDAPDLLDAVAGCCDRLVVVPVPSYCPGALPEPLHGPQFGSYAADEVSWLLRDLSHVALEAPTEEREEAIQFGGGHYAESLPVEYVPSADYRRLFEKALAASAPRVATAVGVVTELVLARRGDAAVLVSLARAGTPIGILMRRWAQFAHGIDVPHHAVSIVRGRGIDPVALRWLARNHDPARVMFVDGWTGKGAIARELAAAVGEHAVTTGHAFGDDLAVLADPGHCVSIYGTRDDFLVPSACLNSTVSGLVSRTVLNDYLIGPGDFHGAKFYAELADVDVSGHFLDAISGQFPAVVDAVAAGLATPDDHEPTWRGWAAIERIGADYGIGDVNLVKPGVGETTRVLLRRVPWRILARPGAGADIEHVLLLAAERGVPVEYVDGLAYSCVGLIHPHFSRGAVGATGRSASTGSTGSSAKPLVVCDLDRTLIYSAAAMGTDPPPVRCVERFGGVDASFMTVTAADLLRTLRRRSDFVPTTTRTREQYARISLPGRPARYAIVANGGHLLDGGVADLDWHRAVLARLTDCAPLAEAHDRLRRHAGDPWLRRERIAEDLFCYAIVDRELLPPAVLAELTGWYADRGWVLSLQGGKLYCVPRPLTKSAAAAEVARRTGADVVLAAGDSLLDTDLLEYADVAVRPAHGELDLVGWTRPGLLVTESAGVRGGEELLRVLLGEVAGYLSARA